MDPSQPPGPTGAPPDLTTPEEAELQHEARWAGTHHRPTRLLGWLLIVAAILDFIGKLVGDSFDLGGLLLVIGGVAILKGSQSWLRFVVFVSCLVPLEVPWLLWSQLKGQPILVGPGPGRGSWVSWDQTPFWIQEVLPIGFFAGVATLGIACLRTRRLRFWTRTAKIWGGIFGGLLLLGAAFTGVRDLLDLDRQDEIRQSLADELREIRGYVGTSGSSYRSGTIDPLREALAARPEIRSLTLQAHPSSSMQVFGRDDDDSSPPAGRPGTYGEFVRGPSGAWIRFEIDVVLPP